MQYEWNVHQVEYPSSECIAWVQWWENPLWLCDIHWLFTVRPIHQPSPTSIPIVQYLTELLESATTLIDNNHPSTIPINGARPTYTANQVREGRAVLQLIRYTDCVIIGSGGVIQWYTISIRLLIHLFPHLLGHATFSTMHLLLYRSIPSAAIPMMIVLVSRFGETFDPCIRSVAFGWPLGNDGCAM